MKKIAFLCAASMLLGGCAVSNSGVGPTRSAIALTPSTPQTARFDWFEYQGDDEVFKRPLGPGEYRNPIVAGFYPDPSVTRVGDDYYMVNSTFGYFPGLPVWHSRDLVNWKQIGNAIDRPGMVDFESLHIGRHGLYAPTIEYHNGRFTIANTCVECRGNFVLTATNPAGP